MGVSVSVKVDLSPITDRLQSADVLERVTREIEADIRPYVKRDTGAVEESAQLMSDYRSGRIVWSATDRGGDYAGYAYEDQNVGAHSGQNPKATARWAEVAKAEKAEEWARMAAEIIAEGL